MSRRAGLWYFSHACRKCQRVALAFRLLYDATSSKLFGFALRILHKRELAEEVLQESFVAVWNNAGSYQSHLASPMTSMANNLTARCSMHCTTRKRRPSRRSK